MSDITADAPVVTDDSGPGTDGTIGNKAWYDAVLAAINLQVYDATRPTWKPKDLYAEIEAARGSEASLDARLDESLNEDGTLKEQADLITVTQLRALIGNKNVAANGDLRLWTNGPALAPDFFVLSGAGAAIARTGSGEADTFSFNAGQYAAKITFGSAAAKLTQTTISATVFGNFARVKGKKFSVAMLGQTGIASHLSIVVDDGVTQTRGGQAGNGTYHTGGGTPEVLYCTHTISNSATKLEVYAEVAAAGAGYVGGFAYIFSENAPSDWPPLSAQVQPGTLPTSILGGRFYANFGSFGNVGSGETDLVAPKYSPNLLDVNGRIVRIVAEGTFAANGNTKTLRQYLGTTATTIFAVTTSGGRWRVEIEIMRSGAATQIIKALVHIGATVLAPVSGTIAETLANDLSLKLTGQSSAVSTNDIVLEYVHMTLV